MLARRRSIKSLLKLWVMASMMGSCVVFAWAALGVLLGVLDPARGVITSGTFRRFEGRQVTTGIISEAFFAKSKRRGKMECSGLCHNTNGCISFNLGTSSPHHCQLLTLTNEDTELSTTSYDQYISSVAKIQDIKTSNNGLWGSSTGWLTCDQGSYIHGIRIHYDSYSGSGSGMDDVGVGIIEFFCQYPSGEPANVIVVGLDEADIHGNWLDLQTCPSTRWVIAFKQSITPAQGSKDDDALNNILFYCLSDANGRSK
ncbi:uncharacterized protein LOC122263171 [Penaeus japonicus]|uniref:uncharacterized protein LOC122263171 n=1 Tax=Penaeus japonicus TaxID=27405 RepID=UPI001C71418E|nr:uncharacterized protein LOC122263171 [Penaeus japonicus]